MTLHDILKPGLRAIICGEAPGAKSLESGHYYADSNDFWKLLHLRLAEIYDGGDVAWPCYVA